MKKQDNLKYALIAAALPWAVFALNLAVPIELRNYGIRPRIVDGLWGIPFAPLLHLNITHLIANTSALFILMLVALSFSLKLTRLALVAIIALGGGLVWLWGQSGTVHIGASGVIFGLLGFLMFVGVFRKEWLALILSLVIFFLYGGALLSLFMHTPGISWAGHFFGFISGVNAAWWTRKAR